MRLMSGSGLAALALCLAGCLTSADDPPQVITGALLIDGTVRPPVPDAVVIVSRGRIRAMGPRTEVPVPEQGRLIEARGRILFPADPAQPLRVGSDANLLLLSVNPAVDPDYLKYVTGRMQNGRWVQYPQ